MLQNVFKKRLEFLSALRSFGQSTADPQMRALLHQLGRDLEGGVILYTALLECQTDTHALSVLLLYFRDKVRDASLTATIIGYITDLFSEITPQDGEEDSKFLSTVRMISDNWNLFKQNKAFRMLSKLLSLSVTLGFCQASNLDFSIAGFKLYDGKLCQIHAESFDLIDAIVNTATYFCETACLCFTQGSLKPLFVDNNAALELDDEYNLVIQWWDLVRNGNLELVANKTNNEFDAKLESVTKRLLNLLPSVRGFDKKFVSDRIAKLLEIKNMYITHMISTGLREAPFFVELFGESCQGKTTFGQMLVDALLASQGLPMEEEYRCVINAAEKYMSTVKTNKIVATVDDICNGKAQFDETNPLNFIHQAGNNQTFVAPKADLHEKARVFLMIMLGIFTTNVKDLNSYIYSNCPYSIQRRMHVVITVKAKEMFQRRAQNGVLIGLDSDLVREHYTVDGVYTPPAFDDLWVLTVERAVKPQKLTEVAHYEVLYWKGKPLEDVDAKTVVQFCIEQFDKHRKGQKAILESKKHRGRNIRKCSHDGCIHLEGMCPLHDEVKDEPHSPQTPTPTEQIGLEDVRNMVRDAQPVYQAGRAFYDTWNWLDNTPKLLVRAFGIRHGFMLRDRKLIAKNYAKWTSIHVGCALVALTLLPWFISFLAVYALLERQASLYRIVTMEYMLELEATTNPISTTLRRVRRDRLQTYALLFGAVGSVVAMFRMYQKWSVINTPQGNLAPNSQQEIDERDAEKFSWTGVTRRPTPMNEVQKTTTANNLNQKIRKNLCYASMKAGGRTYMANGLMLRSNTVLLPNHYFERHDEYEVVFVKHDNPEHSGGKFTTILSVSNSYHIPNTDLRVCYTARGGDFADLTKFFPTTNIEDCAFALLWREKSGTFLEMKGRAKTGITTNGACKFMGGDYKSLTGNTFDGLCGAVLIAETIGTFICGVHLGGVAGTPTGCFGTLTQVQIMAAIQVLDSFEACVLTGTSGVFNPVVLGKQILNGKPLSPKSSLNFIPQGSQIEYFGSCIGLTKNKTQVEQTVISETVKEVCGVENTWGPPTMNPSWFGWQKCLSVMSKPAKSFPPALLLRAVKDYKSPLVALIRQEPWVSMTKLTHSQTICGIKGLKFIDAMKKGTSIGFPLSGPKMDYLVELESTEEHEYNVDFTPEIQAEIDRCHDCYKAGQRAYTIAKACKKDEVLPQSKEKCRIFYGNPVALTYLIRMYYLPVVRFLQMNPLKAECAVGINCHGPEWDQLHDFMITHGKNRIFAGDYSKYDQRMPADLILASLRVLIDLASECNYSEEDICVMKAMCGDVVYAMIAFNGDLIGLTEGSHISGNSLTVIINGIGGSLNLRCFYFNEYPDEKEDFREHVAMITYGDDNKGSVSADRPKFNIKACSEFLGGFGQTYTMPDKDSELVEYMCDEDAEFLKRSSVYHEILGHELGALSQDSIFKMLHNYVRSPSSPLTREEACAQNIDTALMEWFNHGPEVYELRREQMVAVAKSCHIDHLCDRLNIAYGEAAANWFETHFPVKDSSPGSAGC